MPASVTFAASPLTTTPAPLLATVTVSSPAVPLTITLSAAAVTLAAAHRARQVDIDLLGVGSGQVVDRDGVGAAQGVDLDVLDTVEVHGDVADVAEQPHPTAIGRDVHVLGDVCAVEHQRIGAALALDDVAAVAGVPGERIVAVAEESRVVAATADHGVVAVTADAACRRPGCR